MASFIDAFRAGQSVANVGIDAYDRARSWADRLTAREAAKQAADEAKRLEAQRYKEGRIDKEIAADREQDRRAFDQSLAVRRQGEEERHNKAMETWAKDPKNPNAVRAARTGTGAGRSLELNDYQRESLLMKANANYLTAVENNDGPGIQLYGGMIEQYGGEVPPYEDKVPFWKPGHTAKYGAAPAAPFKGRTATGPGGKKLREVAPGVWK